MLKRLPEIGEIRYYMQKEVSVIRIWDCFQLAEIKELASEQNLLVDICTLSSKPNFSNTLSLWNFGRK